MIISTATWVIIITVFVLTSAYATYIFVTDKKKDKIKAILFKKVGNTKQFIGFASLKEKTHRKLGYFLLNKAFGIKIQSPDVDSYVPGQKFKIVMLCKYGTDDWRVMRILRDSQFYTRVNEQEYEDVVDEETGEAIRVPRYDKKGQPVMLEKEIIFNEPIGITQEAQEVWRFNRDFHQAMDEFEKKGQGFWDKYGNLIVNSIVIVAFMVFCLYGFNKLGDVQVEIAQQYGETADKYIQEVQSPLFAERFYESLTRKEQAENAPPS